MDQQTPEGVPQPGTPLSVRRQQIDSLRFVSVRNLAYLYYKKPDGSPLMSYQETLDNRELVKTRVIEHEMSLGLVVQDGSNPNPEQTTQMQPNQPMQFAPPAVASPAAVAQVPVQAPQMMVPQPMVSQMTPPQVPMTPAAAPAVQVPPAAAPEQQQEAAPTGRKRRTAGAAAAPPPAAPVAPPPAAMLAPATAPAAAPQAAPVPVMQFAQPTMPQQAPQAAPAPAAFQPMAFQPAPVQQAPVQAAPQAAAPSQSVDLSPVLTQLASLGKGLEITASNSDAAMKGVDAMQKELAATKLLVAQCLGALHHIYLSTPALQASTQGKANTVPDFQTFLAQYLGTIGQPSPK